MRKFHFKVLEAKRMLKSSDKDLLSKLVNMMLLSSLSDDEQMSLAKIMADKLKNQPIKPRRLDNF